jgi:hypothetical protein
VSAVAVYLVIGGATPNYVEAVGCVVLVGCGLAALRSRNNASTMWPEPWPKVLAVVGGTLLILAGVLGLVPAFAGS